MEKFSGAVKSFVYVQHCGLSEKQFFKEVTHFMNPYVVLIATKGCTGRLRPLSEMSIKNWQTE